MARGARSGEGEAVVAEAEGELGQGVEAGAEAAAAPEEAGDGGELEGGGGAEGVLVGAALGGGEDALVGGVGDDLEEAGDRRFGAGADVGVGGQGEEGGQALEVDREVGGGVELGHLGRLEVVEPGADAGRADGRLRGAEAAGAGEAGGGEEVAGEVGGGVEEEGVVLGEVPLDVVAGLVEPVAVAE